MSKLGSLQSIYMSLKSNTEESIVKPVQWYLRDLCVLYDTFLSTILAEKRIMTHFTHNFSIIKSISMMPLTVTVNGWTCMG